MQEYNFERQVKETMENFSVPPSTPVWQKIEKEIRQKKERRKVVLWLLPLLFAGGLWLMLSERRSDGNDASATIQSTPASTEQNSPAKAPLAPVDPVQTKTTDVTASTNKQPLTYSTTKDTREISREIVTGKDGSFISSGKSTNNRQFKRPHANTSDSKNKKPASRTTYPAISSLNTGITSDTSKIITIEPEAAPDISPAAEITKTPPEVLTIDIKTDTVAVASAEPKIEPTSRPRKWKIGVQATGGYAQMMKTFFPTTAMPEASVVPTAIGFIPRVGPNEPTPGPAFSAGVMFTNTLSTNMKFTTGLQYNYASTFQQFGEKSVGSWNGVTPQSQSRDSSIVLYRSGNQFRYTNKYHFAEIPAAVEMRLFSTLPVNLHAGVSLSVLVASNAVSFDGSNDLYYHQKDKLNALGVNVHGGFSYSFAKERLKIGPHLQYDLMPVHIGSEKRYLLTGGIRTTVSLN